MFQAAIYRPCASTPRWAVFDNRAHVWYFPTRYGRRAAEAMARRLNSEIRP